MVKSADEGRSGARSARRTAESCAALALLAAGYVLQVLGALGKSASLVIAGAVLGVLADILVLRRERALARRLARAQCTAAVRQMVRDALLLGGLAGLDVLRPGGRGGLLLPAVLACWVLHFLCQAVAGAVRTRRRLPVVTRNIDASGLRPSAGPPGLFVRRGPLRLAVVGVLVTAAMAVSAGTGEPLWAESVAVCCGAVLLAGTAYLATWLLPGKRVASEEEALAWLEGWLAGYRPTVGLYFSGGNASAYQANMWLTTLSELDGRPLIVLRERFMVQKIEATDVPILCVPKVAHLMRLEHSTLKVLLHPANSGKTSQVLRIPTLKHAFINHGESDKLSSCNPYAKAYDQVWVAGEAARERYAQADIGVEDKDVVEVGRPQLAPIEPAPAREGAYRRAYLTVLYAPTWEGWTDDPGNTSVLLAGEAIVSALLADPGVRLLYKPHPMTGSVDPRAGAADRRIRALIAHADAERAREHAREPHGGRAGREAVAALDEATRRLDELTRSAFRPDADEVERMLRQPAPEPGRALAVAEATRAWEAAFWASLPAWEHQVVTGGRPTIFSCFNEADLLVSDVSSVVSDYLSSEKPYAVVNTGGLDEEGFRTANPTVRAATILGPDGAGVPELLAAVRLPEEDRLAPARAALKVRLLGPAEPPSLVRFNRAVHALAAEAEAREERAQRVAERAAELRPVDADAEVETERELTRSQALVEELGDSEGF
ncbi:MULTISPECIES: hypothetical protein [unclassified Streptomyces]|uniref:hypothetical protein n=1 Tax=unclassified Streptomyces TaxID=2593676 RepID=UPI002DD8B271|nr:MULTISPECIES: hypothetical protein [unclassified Streptomyces]WSA94393.1 hypothetical protein OIE63_24570 [Streptomyces sp. NBC_01795]WSB78811.1 hypothetical protein OHB04_25685 [Streptomyces sp. NBC_01775]WSS41769.1 hypothetical protein OG220_15075 [Streptomyces sp. NBC_01187]